MECGPLPAPPHPHPAWAAQVFRGLPSGRYQFSGVRCTGLPGGVWAVSPTALNSRDFSHRYKKALVPPPPPSSVPEEGAYASVWA